MATPSPSASPSASTTLATKPAGTVMLLDPTFGEMGRFRSPSGNVTCFISTDTAGCHIREYAWPKPADDGQGCDGDNAEYLAGVRMEVGGAQLESSCLYAHESEDVGVMAYDTGWQLGNTRCLSELRGVTCLLRSNGDGFTISRERVSVKPLPSPLTTARANPPGNATTTVIPAGFSASFHTPSGRFICQLESNFASCDARGDIGWSPPPYDDSSGPCDLDETTGVTVEGRGKGRAFTGCASDEPDHGPELAYGHAVQVGDLRCTSDKRGLTCRHGDRGHGFFVNREIFTSY